MKIRTITTGFCYHPDMKKEEFDFIGEACQCLKSAFQNQGYEVQTIRMSTQPWSAYAQTKQDLFRHIKILDQWMKTHHIDYFNIGPTQASSHIEWIPEILQTSPTIFTTTPICSQTKVFYEHITQVAKVIKKNASLEPFGFANLRFAALCNIPPRTPFYPASYHQHDTSPSFAIGLENSDLVYQAFAHASSLDEASTILQETFLRTYQPLETLAYELSKKYHIGYDGIDTSISTSIDKMESIAYAFEHLFKTFTFGEPGTLTIAKIITDIIQHLPIKKTGYCGLMLPVLEDHGLAKRNKQGKVAITNLLLYSAVCGTGLDTIPLPGAITKENLIRILCDVATLSIKLQKPLSARLMPIPHLKPGDQTTYDFPYFKNSSVMNPR